MNSSKNLNNVQTFDNSFTKKKEEKNASHISLIGSNFQPMIGRSTFSNKK